MVISTSGIISTNCLKDKLTKSSVLSLSFKSGSYRVSMTHTRDVLARCPIFHCKCGFVDQFSSSGRDHVTSQKAVSLLVRQHFHNTINLGVCSSAAVCGQRELSNLVRNPLKKWQHVQRCKVSVKAVHQGRIFQGLKQADLVTHVNFFPLAIWGSFWGWLVFG